jgi:hypothetical protein
MFMIMTATLAALIVRVFVLVIMRMILLAAE